MALDIQPDQALRIKIWHKTHICNKASKHPEHGTTRGALWYCVSNSSGIGVAVEGRCDCGENINVTDYDTW